MSKSHGGKQKTHSGAKKTFKRNKNGKGNVITVGKAASRHLLVNKSKGQKSIDTLQVHPTRMRAVRKMLKGVKAPS